MFVINRTIYLGGEITEELCSDFFEHFSKLALTKDPITIIIHGSEGGNWSTAGSPMVDLIINTEHHVTVIGYGEICSTAAILFICGDRRILTQRALLMIHAGSSGLQDPDANELTKLSSVVNQCLEQELDFLVSRSEKGPKYWSEKLKEDFYIFHSKQWK